MKASTNINKSTEGKLEKMMEAANVGSTLCRYVPCESHLGELKGNLNVQDCQKQFDRDRSTWYWGESMLDML